MRGETARKGRETNELTSKHDLICLTDGKREYEVTEITVPTESIQDRSSSQDTYSSRVF
jgi:hypothetical protein